MRKFLLGFVVLVLSALGFAQGTVQNLDDTLVGWQNPPCLGPSCAGGVGTPSAWNQTINNASPSLDGASMLISVTGPVLTDGQTTNVLWPYKTGPNNTVTTFSTTYSVYFPSISNIAAFEADMFQFNSGQRFMFGTECDTGSVWRFWNQLAGTWVSSSVACTLTAGSWHTITLTTHRIIGDTSCSSGNPCMYYDTLTIDGTVNVLNIIEPSGPSGDPDNNGVQFQIDVSALGGTATAYLDEISLTAGPQTSATLPQVWANNLESAPPGGIWDVTKTMGVDYASTGAGLQAALTAWCAAPDQWWHVINPHGNVISVTSLMTACGKSGATKFFVLDSDTPLPVSQTVCSHQTIDLPGGGNPRNYQCTNDKGSMGIIDGNWASGNNGQVFQTCTVGNSGCPVATNHIAIWNQEIRMHAGATFGGSRIILFNSLDANITGTGTVNHLWLINDFIHADAIDASPYFGGNLVSSAVVFSSCSYCGMAYSYMDEVIANGFESHGVYILWSNGPLKFVHNWIEGTSINIFTAGASTTVLPYLNVYDMEIRGNRFTKPASWMPVSTGTAALDLKSTGELKTCTRCLIDGNIFENSNNNGAQNGQCFTYTPRNSNGATQENYSTVDQDLTWTNNICRHANTGIQTDGRSGVGASLPTRRLSTDNDLFYDISPGNSIIYNGTSPFYITEVGGSTNSWTCTASRNSAGTQSTYTCADGGGGLHQMDVTAGDLMNIQSCLDSTFSTGFRSGSFPAKGTPALLILSGLSFITGNTGTANATTTGCIVKNNQGFPSDYSVTHISIFAAAPDVTATEPRCLNIDGYAQRPTYKNNLIAVNPSRYGGLMCQGDGNFEGTTSETDMFDTSTLIWNHNIHVGRTASNYTDWPGSVSPSVANWFPANVVCPSSSADSTCIGIQNMMSGAAFNANPTDYHTLALDPSSLYKAGGSRQASDGLQIGANITQIDTHLNSTIYVCGSSCGTGPFSDVQLNPPNSIPYTICPTCIIGN